VNTENIPADPSAILDVSSTSKGFLPPRMTTAERDAIPSPAEGLLIYNTDAKGLNIYNGSQWTILSGGFECGLSQVADADGHLYNTVMIGQQCWMASNLNSGIRLNLGVAPADNDTVEKYCYNDSTENCDTYGGLYRWDEAMQYVHTEGARGICPDGWHIPTPAEYDTLIANFGGADTAGAALKETGYEHWYYSFSSSSTNTSGFTALGGGQVLYNYQVNPPESYQSKKSFAFFWASSWTGASTNAAILMLLRNYEAWAYVVGSELEYPHSFSVRCVRVDP
jgi:uncharacterized protein (TIGR02145 family)